VDGDQPLLPIMHCSLLGGLDLQPPPQQRAGDGLGVDAVRQLELLHELLTPGGGGGGGGVLLPTLRPAAHPQPPPHLFDGQLLREEGRGVQAEGEAAAPHLLDRHGLEDPPLGPGPVHLLEEPVVKPLHVLQALPRLHQVEEHLLLHQVEERPAGVQERPHREGGRPGPPGTAWDQLGPAGTKHAGVWRGTAVCCLYTHTHTHTHTHSMDPPSVCVCVCVCVFTSSIQTMTAATEIEQS